MQVLSPRHSYSSFRLIRSVTVALLTIISLAVSSTSAHAIAGCAFYVNGEIKVIENPNGHQFILVTIRCTDMSGEITTIRNTIGIGGINGGQDVGIIKDGDIDSAVIIANCSGDADCRKMEKDIRSAARIADEQDWGTLSVIQILANFPIGIFGYEHRPCAYYSGVVQDLFCRLNDWSDGGGGGDFGN